MNREKLEQLFKDHRTDEVFWMNLGKKYGVVLTEDELVQIEDANSCEYAPENERSIPLIIKARLSRLR